MSKPSKHACGLRERARRVAELGERLAPQADLRAGVGRVAVRAVDQRGDVVRHRHEGVETHGVADRPGRDHRHCDTERDRDSRDPFGRGERAEQQAQRDDHDHAEEDALRPGQRREADRCAERNEVHRLRIVVGAVRAEQEERHERDVERLGHQGGLAEEEHRVHRGQRRRGEPDRVGRHPAAQQPDERDGACAHERHEDPLLLHRVRAEPGRQRQQHGEQRRVLRGRAAEVQQQVVERPDVAATVGEARREQVIRAGVAERGHLGRDHDDERDADRERHERDGGERQREPPRPAAHFDAGTAIGRLTPGRWHPPSSRPPALSPRRRARAAGAPERPGRSAATRRRGFARGTRPRR